VVIGAFPEMFNTFHEIYLPLHLMWEPNRWTTLVHESAHCVIRQDGRRFGKDNEAFVRVVDQSRSIAGSDHGNIVGRLNEFLADAIAMAFSPFWELPLIEASFCEAMATLAEFNIRFDEESRLESYLVRWMAMEDTADLLCRTMNEAHGLQIGHAPGDVEEDSSIWSPRAMAFRKRMHGLNPDTYQVEKTFEWCKPLIEYAAQVARDLVAGPHSIDSVARHAWWQTQAKEVCASIADRRAVNPADPVTPVTFPELLIWALFARFPRAHQMSYAQRSAAISTLAACFRNEIRDY
jgi:hypothetical protein